jgi:hypothetical protein
MTVLRRRYTEATKARQLEEKTAVPLARLPPIVRERLAFFKSTVSTISRKKEAAAAGLYSTRCIQFTHSLKAPGFIQQPLEPLSREKLVSKFAFERVNLRRYAAARADGQGGLHGGAVRVESSLTHSLKGAWFQRFCLSL